MTTTLEPRQNKTQRSTPCRLGSLLFAVAGACFSTASDARYATAPALPAPTLFAAGLESPWGMAVLPDGRLLVTERAGHLRIVSADGASTSAPVAGLPCVDQRGHGGLLDVAIDPAFKSNRLIYFSYTEAAHCGDESANGLTVARARLARDGSRIDGLQVLFRQLPRVESTENLGGRLAISKGGYLFITMGDRRVLGEREKAQDLASYQGKTLRIRTDGSVPASNPFVGRTDALPEIWTLGHRNPQGAFVHPKSGELWVAEHGPFGGDEVNIARKGRNYGWPIVSFGCEYDTCAPIGDGSGEKAGMEPPLAHWGKPSIAPSNLMFYSGDGHRGGIKAWRGNVLVGALAGRAVWRLALAERNGVVSVVRREPLYADLGLRIRDLKQGPGGSIYLLTDGSGAQIVRIGGAGAGKRGRLPLH